VKLLVATSNAGKLAEIREILAGIALELLSLRDVRLPPPDETGATFHDNAAQKSTICARQSGLWTLADDSGLCVDALGGAPGVHSARYAPTDEERRARLLRALREISEEKRTAYFFCAVALSPPEGERVLRAEGQVDGERTGSGTIRSSCLRKRRERRWRSWTRQRRIACRIAGVRSRGCGRSWSGSRATAPCEKLDPRPESVYFPCAFSGA